MLFTTPFDDAGWSQATGANLHLRIGCAPPIVGQARSLAELERFWAETRGFGLDFCEAWHRNEVIWIETDVGIETSRSLACLPCAVVARTYFGLIQDLRFYVDLSTILQEHADRASGTASGGGPAASASPPVKSMKARVGEERASRPSAAPARMPHPQTRFADRRI